MVEHICTGESNGNDELMSGGTVDGILLLELPGVESLKSGGLSWVRYAQVPRPEVLPRVNECPTGSSGQP